MRSPQHPLRRHSGRPLGSVHELAEVLPIHHVDDAAGLLDAHSFTLEIELGPVDERQDDVRARIGHQFDGDVTIARKGLGSPLIVTLTVPAADLWLSLLLAMATVTRTGYEPRSVEAMPTADFERIRSGRRGPASET